MDERENSARSGTCSTCGNGHIFIKLATPGLNGKVERSHRSDAEEFYRMRD